MNKLSIYALMSLRAIYRMKSGRKVLERPECDQDPDSASQKIYELLINDKPCMIARFGANELNTLVNYLGVKIKPRKSLAYISGRSPSWWWNKNTIQLLHIGAGFFPATEKKVEQFCELMLQDIPLVDILGSWRTDERYFEKELKGSQRVRLLALDPYWAQTPWTRALEDKKILVVHPFADTIQRQYKIRELLFENNLLPRFELKTIKAVQSIAGEQTPFADWFEALDYMKTEIDKTDYDICLIGAGAYGFPLAAHVKRMGKKAFHIGGSLQLLFGIRGKRWDKNYNDTYDYSSLVNKFWVSPDEIEKPNNADAVEGACYW